MRSQKKFLDVLAEETAHATGKDTNGKHAASKKTELTELARQSAEAYIDAQKKLLDVATQQLKVNAKTAREAISAMNPLPAETFGELARHTVEGFVESQQALLNLMVKPAPKAARRRGTPETGDAQTRRRGAAQARCRSRVKAGTGSGNRRGSAADRPLREINHLQNH